MSGDRQWVKEYNDGVLIVAIDALGHGAKAAKVADFTITILEKHWNKPVLQLVTLCHNELHRSRGVVMCIVSISAHNNLMKWISVGNIGGQLLRSGNTRSPSKEWLITQNGVVGYNLPTLHTHSISVDHFDMLILTSDGISDFTIKTPIKDISVQDTADYILNKYKKMTDDASVLVVRYLGGII
jgi:negative regulator of sigma-B (phosphoserine phosphatase)